MTSSTASDGSKRLQTSYLNKTWSDKCEIGFLDLNRKLTTIFTQNSYFELLVDFEINVTDKSDMVRNMSLIFSLG